jgi:hypothetical protein
MKAFWRVAALLLSAFVGAFFVHGVTAMVGGIADAWYRENIGRGLQYVGKSTEFSRIQLRSGSAHGLLPATMAISPNRVPCENEVRTPGS